MVGRRGEDRENVFEEYARLGEIRCFGDSLAEIFCLLFALFAYILYFITGEFGGYKRALVADLAYRLMLGLTGGGGIGL